MDRLTTVKEAPPCAVLIEDDGDLKMLAGLGTVEILPGVHAHAIAEVWTAKVSRN
jgi:hypothetical protein